MLSFPIEYIVICAYSAELDRHISIDIKFYINIFRYRNIF